MGKSELSTLNFLLDGFRRAIADKDLDTAEEYYPAILHNIAWEINPKLVAVIDDELKALQKEQS